MKKVLYIAMGLLAASTFVSCNDNDFLKEDPKAKFSIDNAYNTSSQVESTLAAAYAEMQNKRFGYVNGMQSDEFSVFSVFGASGFTIGTWSATGNWNCSTAGVDRVNAKDMWDNWYKVAAYANQALYACDLETIKWASDSEKTQIKAEAQLLRGYSYLKLAECFGGVPIVNTYSEALRLDYERASRTETYKFAISDLEAAYNGLPTKPVAGRAGKGAAAIMLSEAYLGLGVAENNSSNYTTAASWAQKCIDIHPLMTSRFGARVATAAGSNLGVPNAMPDPTEETLNTEAYYGTPFSDLFYKQNPRLAENTEAVWIMCGPASYAEQQSASSSYRVMSHRAYSPAIRDTKLAGSSDTPWPTSAANSDFYKKVGTSMTSIPAIASNGVPFGGAPSWFATVQVFDPEHDKTTQSPMHKWSYLGDDRGKEGVSVRRYYPVTNESHPAYSKSGEQLYGTNADMKGWEDIDHTNVNTSMEYFPIHDKRTPVDSWGYDENTYFTASVFGANLFRDQYVYRSAEAYLLLAEAQLRAGNKAEAAKAMNVVRTRAHAAEFSADEMTLQVLLDERCRELIYEEDRWSTLLRQEPETWKPRIYSYNTWSYTKSLATLNPNEAGFPETQVILPSTGGTEVNLKWNLWPIPKDYIDLNTDNPDGMKQNEGWGDM